MKQALIIAGAVLFVFGLNILIIVARRMRAPKVTAADLRPIVMTRGMRYVIPGLVGEWRLSEVSTISGLADDVEARLTMRRVRFNDSRPAGAPHHPDCTRVRADRGEKPDHDGACALVPGHPDLRRQVRS